MLQDLKDLGIKNIELCDRHRLDTKEVTTVEGFLFTRCKEKILEES
jgi:hypothetical protein